MKKKFLLLFSLLVFLGSCGQDYNSNYNDRGTYADIGIPPGTPLYNSYKILQNKCFSCHAAKWQDFKTNQAWIDSGEVTKGSFDTSSIKTNLVNFGGSMPLPPNASLTDAEVETLRSWVNGL
ncbi:MAG: hypothetical protein H7281_02020 [Bacteriovorax sp.]|nr:hypothetical protein [Bacteriovorax sp.]